MNDKITEELIKSILEVGLDKAWGGLKRANIEVKRKLLDLWLKADFEKFILPEEVEIGLLDEERKYPKLLFSPEEMPTELDKRPFMIAFDFEDPLFKDVIRCAYWVSVLVDNFLPEAKAMLPLEGRYALALSQAEIRASRRGESEIIQLFRCYSGEEFELPKALINYIGEKVVKWNEVLKFKKKIDMILESGLYFSVFLPILKEYCKKKKGVFAKEELEVFISFLDYLYNLEKQIRTKTLEPKMRIFDSKIFGKIGFVPITPQNPPTSIVSFIEEKFNEECDNVIVLSRDIINNSIAIEAVVMALGDLENINIPTGIKSVNLEESFAPGIKKWRRGVRIFLTRDYKDVYLKRIEEIKKLKNVFLEMHHLDLIMIVSDDPKEILIPLNLLKNQLDKRKRLYTTTLSTGGFEPACLIETIQLLAQSRHFTKNVLFFIEEDKTPQIRFCVDMKLLE